MLRRRHGRGARRAWHRRPKRRVRNDAKRVYREPVLLERFDIRLGVPAPQSVCEQVSAIGHVHRFRRTIVVTTPRALRCGDRDGGGREGVLPRRALVLSYTQYSLVMLFFIRGGTSHWKSPQYIPMARSFGMWVVLPESIPKSIGLDSLRASRRTEQMLEYSPWNRLMRRCR